jgi:hypothetical protein
MHKLILVYFVNLYMFGAYLGPSSGGTTVCVQQLVLIILWHKGLLSWLDFQTGQQTTGKVVHQVDLSLLDYIEMHFQQNIKSLSSA